MNFQHKGINYSVINETTKTARIGLSYPDTNSNSAVANRYAKALFIPQFVYCENIKYEVVEAGTRCCQYCTLITEISLPCSIVALRSGCFDGCTGTKSFIFRKGSKLEVIESDALARLYSIKTLVLPPTIKSINTNGICCHTNLQALYVCGLFNPTDRVFFETDPSVMPLTVPIYVSRLYPYSVFSTRNVTIADFTDKCFPQEKTCNIRHSSSQSIKLLTLICAIIT